MLLKKCRIWHQYKKMWSGTWVRVSAVCWKCMLKDFLCPGRSECAEMKRHPRIYTYHHVENKIERTRI